MKKFILFLSIMFLVTTFFSTTIQEISQDFGRRLSYSSTLSQESIENFLNDYPFKRLFVVDDGEKTFCSLITENQESEIDILTFKTSDFSKTESLLSKTAVLTYIQVQKALFDITDVFSSYSTNKLILDDMSYIEYFTSILKRVESYANNSFKNNENVEKVTHYIDEQHRLNVIFYNNFNNYFSFKPIDFTPTVYEEDDENLPLKAYKYMDEEIYLSYSQIEIFSFLALYDDYMDAVVENVKTDSSNSPYMYLFDKEQKKNALITATNLNFLKYIANSIKKELEDLNKTLSKSYGVIEVDDLKSLLMLETKFEMIVYKTFESAVKNANNEGKKKTIEIFINREIEYKNADEFLKKKTEELKAQIYNSCSVLSKNENSFELMNELLKTDTLKTKKIKPVKDEVKVYDTIEMINSFEVESEEAHFAIINADIGLSSDASETFKKIYPIFSTECTKDKPLVLVDFFWVAANHVAQTLWKTLKTLVWNGFDLKQLESEFSVENAELKVEEYVKFLPYHDLYRMLPSYDKRLTLEIKNTNLGYLVLNNLFAGNVPAVLMDSVSEIPETEDYDLARYPIEFYNTEKAITSDVERKNKAIIFVHGKQNIPYFDDNFEIISHIDAVWRNDGRLDVWNKFYQYVNEHPDKFKEYDFYEYTYDTSVYPASKYGQILSEILIKNGIHKSYNDITMFASSMGGLVSRYCINHQYNKEKFGDYIKQLITLDTPHLGTLAQNFILAINPRLIEAVDKLEVGTPPDINLTMGNFLYSFIDGTESLKSAELMLYFTRRHPEMVGKLFTEMLRFLDPFPGGLCMLYTPESFCESLGLYLYSDTKDKTLENIFLAEPETIELNSEDKYLDKLYLVSAELTNESTDITSGLSVTYSLMKIVGDMLSHQTMENLSRHGRNDGVVNLYSQQMWGIDKGQERQHFMNLDHLAVPRSTMVVEYLMENRILK